MREEIVLVPDYLVFCLPAEYAKHRDDKEEETVEMPRDARGGPRL